ncbi:MAG TPA: S8 family serine peptidase [Reyranella sp.]|jgi:subtilisin family serine protease
MSDRYPYGDVSDNAARSVAIADQIIISFERKELGLLPTEQVNARIEEVLEPLAKFGVRELTRFVPKPPIKEAFVAIVLVRLVGHTLSELQEELKKYKDVDFAERNAPIVLASYDDPLLRQQWALAKLGADKPWTVAPPPGGKKVCVALVDSGVRRFGNYLHADMGSVEAGGGIDRDGHGTQLAGIIAAAPNNGTGLASPIPTNWNTISLQSVQFCGPPYFRGSPNAYDGFIAIWTAAASGFDAGVNTVINLSWHVAPGDAGLGLLELGIWFATRVFDCVVVVAAGNDGTNNEIYPFYPANFRSVASLKDRVMTVAASDRHDGKAFFSNFGKNTVDIAAPGMHILTTARYLVDPPRYAEISGTSPAAAYVSAGAALVWALNPGWIPEKVIQHLKVSADRIAALKPACINGKRLNLGRAVYGPLHVDTPRESDVVEVGVDTANITWTVDYNNPSFTSVALSFVDTTNTEYMLPGGTVPALSGAFLWAPKSSDPLPPRPAMGSIKIMPTTGNFPAFSPLFQLL